MSRTPKVTRELCEQLKALDADGLSPKGLAKFGRVSSTTISVLKSKSFDYDAYREYSAQSFNILAKRNELKEAASTYVLEKQPSTVELLEKLKLHIDQISVGLNLLLKEAQK